MDDFAPSILLVDEKFLEMGLELKSRCVCVEHVILIEEQANLPAGVLSYTDLLADGYPNYAINLSANMR